MLAIKRIYCQKCPSYDSDVRKCTQGKANPRKQHETLTLVELLGTQTVCMHNPWREELLLRMYRQPKAIGYWSLSAAQVETHVDLEWLDNNP